ncbi:hypothetical protein ANCDUO_03350 [Ancylostoma duodenale]|uniref:Uncharacterized protein n=1 Tax=Ancylostoma duodenale TaxID=51022 RepID=A0A0C2DU39_9BILA|nr:hypothetical protein ANCDUO_03350 [Ancylostoma duodenale]
MWAPTQTRRTIELNDVRRSGKRTPPTNGTNAEEEEEDIEHISSRVDSVVKPIKDMVCVDVNVLAVIGEASKRIRAAGINGIDFACVHPEFNCEGRSCSLCADVDFNLAMLGSADKFHNCLPRS